ncbi:alpha/beta hydrolase family protein [Streptomyces sp. NPDC090029]|uniref:alpha/beta hydrolase family protein n=1 Tax=Streptomyces sp. NPDC090029 TaxID=3365924 RepID=UPI0038189869
MAGVTELITGLHLSLSETLLVLAATAAVAARWLPPAARGPAALAAAGATAASAGAVALSGLRWQLVPVLVAAVLALPFALAPVLRRGEPGAPRRAPWWAAGPATLLCGVLIAAGPAASWALPVPVLPEPTGPYGVGTTTVQWTDPDRPEPATAEPGDRRTVVAQLWYPADRAGGPRARYLGRTANEARTVGDALAGYAGLPAFALDGAVAARGRAVPDAPVSARGGRFPVVLFSPGLGGVRTQNTAWAQELASHGYAVAALDHPYDSAAVVLDDGRTVRTGVAASGDTTEDERRAAGWTAVRAADLRFALTRLGRIDRGEAPGLLAGRLDTRRAAVAGHSLGGAAALLAAAQDDRFAAAVDLDGFPRDTGPRVRTGPVLALTQAVGPDTDPDYLPRLRRALEAGTAPGYRLTVPGAAHLTFTDAPLYLPPLPSLVGSLGRTGGHRITAGATLAFLDAVLAAEPGDPAHALAAYGELTVHRPRGG